MTDQRFSRQILAFGEQGHQRLARAKVGIVGLGGIGSHVVQSLAYLGVQSFMLVDDDRVDISNLNRLVGATPPDAERTLFKTEVAERLIRQVNQSAAIHPVPYNLRSTQAIEVLTSAEVLFGCVDHDGPRLVLTELAAAYEIPLIDSATEIFAPDHRLEDFGGRVVVARPREFCLLCANQLDLELAKWELLSPEERALRSRHGYGLGELVPAPAVISVNGVVANLAVTEFIMVVTGQREPSRLVTYKGMRGVVTRSTDEKKPDCYICGYLVGQRDKANLMRYIRSEVPRDIPA